MTCRVLRAANRFLNRTCYRLFSSRDSSSKLVNELLAPGVLLDQLVKLLVGAHGEVFGHFGDGVARN